MTKKKVNKKIFKTIRIYEADHELLLKTFSRMDNFAEIINQLINNKIRGLK
jgi:hypothetical protein